MKIDVYVKVRCPYCGFEFTTPAVKFDGRSIVIYCPSDDGGCDQPFAAFIPGRVDVSGVTKQIDLSK